MKKINKNSLYIILGLILEIIIFSTMWGTEAKLSFIAAVLSIPCGLFTLWYMDKSYENTIIATVFTIFLLPIGGYIFLRIGLLDKQWIFYTVFYLVILFFLIKNGMFKRIKNNYNLKNKYIRLALVILLVINVLFAFNKQVSFMIISLSFVPFMFLFYVINSSTFKEKKAFYNKILKAAALGALISAFPDFIYYVIFLIKGQIARVFGPLGSNAIIIYVLLMFIIVLSQWVKEKGIKNIWTLYIIGYILVLGIQESRGALIAIFSTFILYLIFDIKNWKKYISVFALVGIMMSYNVSIRPDVVNDINNINEIIEENNNLVVEEDNIDKSESSVGLKEVLFKLIDSQSRNRQILWKTGINITDDYKLTGVGIGNFKFFFNEYSGSDRPYSDAHNILLNLSSELGLPFMILSVLLMIKLGVDMLIGYFKNRKNSSKLTYLSIGICLVGFLLYGNLTGIPLNFNIEVYSFSSTFIILFILFYRDNIEVFS